MWCCDVIVVDNDVVVVVGGGGVCGGGWWGFSYSDSKLEFKLFFGDINYFL